MILNALQDFLQKTDALQPNTPGHPLSNLLYEFDSPCIHKAHRPYALLHLPRTNARIIKLQNVGGGVKANALIVCECSKPNNCHDDCPFIIELN